MAVGSRSARGAETRARILSAARSLLGEVGAERFTTRAVADRAGISHGQTHYHFTSKSDLVLALIDDARRDWVDPLEALVASEGSATNRMSKIIEWIAKPATAEVMRVHQTLYAYALEDANARERLAREYSRWREAFVTLFEAAAGELGLADFDARRLGEGFASAADNLVQQQVLEPDLPTGTILIALFRRLTAS